MEAEETLDNARILQLAARSGVGDPGSAHAEVA